MIAHEDLRLFFRPLLTLYVGLFRAGFGSRNKLLLHVGVVRKRIRPRLEEDVGIPTLPKMASDPNALVNMVWKESTVAPALHYWGCSWHYGAMAANMAQPVSNLAAQRLNWPTGARKRGRPSNSASSCQICTWNMRHGATTAQRPSVTISRRAFECLQQLTNREEVRIPLIFD